MFIIFSIPIHKIFSSEERIRTIVTVCTYVTFANHYEINNKTLFLFFTVFFFEIFSTCKPLASTEY